MQYDEWKSELNDILLTRSPGGAEGYHDRNYDDPVYGIAWQVSKLNDRIEMVEKAAKEAAPDIYDYLMLAVTKEKSYTYLKMELEIPCGKDYFYDRYRRFFFILDKSRD